MKRTICAVFDVDDTLYLERDYVRSGFEAAGQWAANSLDIDGFAECCWDRFLAGSRGSIFDEVLSTFGKQPTAELLSSLVEVYRTHTPSIALAPDASEALNAISHTSSISISVVTDGPVASQSRKVDALGLRSLAAPIVLTRVFGVEFEKPHPKAFEYVEQHNPASIYLYAADNPLKDFTAPKRRGWVTVRVRRPGGLHCMVENSEISADYEMSDCSKLPDVLASLT